jgi:cystathionine gamma-synthase
LEQCLAALEDGSNGLVFASGMAAEDTLLRALAKPGDHVVIPDDAYGGTFRLFDKVLQRWGLENTTVRISDPDAVRAAIRPGQTTMVWVETPTNPLLRIADIEELAAIAHDADALLVVDNTFATPYLQQPIRLGADIVVHSTTKYCGGHSDVIGGALVTRTPELVEPLAFHQNAMGPVAGPFDSWLVLRGLKTLGVRMERHSDNAERVAEFLTTRPEVTEVYFPGLPNHPGHAVAKRQMKRYGGMVSFKIQGGESAALDLVARTRVFTLAESLGGVESLIEHPGRMTHASIAGSARELPPDLIRLSVGIETVDDLVDDLAQAFDA